MYLPPAQAIKNLQFNCFTMTEPTNKLKLDPNRYMLELSEEPNNARNGPEPVK